MIYIALLDAEVGDPLPPPPPPPEQPAVVEVIDISPKVFNDHGFQVIRIPGSKNLFLVYTTRSPDDIHYIKSTDGGLTWSSPVSFISDTPYVGVFDYFAMGYALNRIVLAYGFSASDSKACRVVTSTDEGVTWTTYVDIYTGIWRMQPFSLMFEIQTNGTFSNPGYLLCKGTLGVTDVRLYKSTDGGLTWPSYNTFSSGPPMEDVAYPMLVIPGKVFVLRDDTGDLEDDLMVTDDDGSTWSTQKAGLATVLYGDQGPYLSRGSFDKAWEIGQSFYVYGGKDGGNPPRTIELVTSLEDDDTQWTTPANFLSNIYNLWRQIVIEPTRNVKMIFYRWETIIYRTEEAYSVPGAQHIMVMGIG